MSEKEHRLNHLINQHLKPIYNYVYRIVGNRDEADDITQEVFIKIWKNLDKINTQKNFQIWLFKVARNATIDHLRKKKSILFSALNTQKHEQEELFEETLPDVEPLPDEIFQRKELRKDLENILTKIRPDFKEIILLHYMENLTLENIAEIIDRPVNTVKSQHRRALISLRQLLIGE